MSLSIIAATGDKRDVSAVVVRDEGGVSRVISEVWARDESNVSRQVWIAGGAASGTANPDYVSGAVSSRTARPVPTDETTVTAPAGSTFAWSSAAGWMVNAPTAATTRFTALAVEPGEERTRMFTCTVTVPGGGTTTASVTASASNYYDGGNDGPLQ